MPLRTVLISKVTSIQNIMGRQAQEPSLRVYSKVKVDLTLLSNIRIHKTFFFVTYECAQ
jgi:hypothetical protein